MQLKFQDKVSTSNCSKNYALSIGLSCLDGETGEDVVSVLLSDNSIRLFRLDTLKPFCVVGDSGNRGMITSTRFLRHSPAVLVSSDADGLVRCWDVRQPGKEATKLTSHNSCSLLCVDVDCQDRVVCAGSERVGEDAFVLFWDLRMQHYVGFYDESHSDNVSQVCFHPRKEDSLLSGGTDGLVNVYDISQESESDALLETWNFNYAVNGLGWTSHEHVFAVAYSDAVGVHSLQQEDDRMFEDLSRAEAPQMEYLINVHEHEQHLFLVGGTNSGKLAISALGHDSLESRHAYADGHEATIRCSAFDPAKRLLLTGDEQGTLALWTLKHAPP